MSVLDLQRMTPNEADEEEQMLHAREDNDDRRGSGLSVLVY